MRLSSFLLLVPGLHFLVFSLAGCAGSWRPATSSLEKPAASNPEYLAACLRACRSGEWVYQRYELPDQEPDARYIRRIDQGLLSERVISDPPLLALEELLPPQLPSAHHTEKALLTRLPRTASLVMFELAEPLQPIPAYLTDAEPVIASTTIRYFDYRGQLGAEGTLKRVVEVEGMEDVQTPAGQFGDCLRVRVDLTVHFPWLLWMDWTSYLWLSPEVGEVRRVHRLSGWFLIFWFSSTHEYGLISHEPGVPASQREATVGSRPADLPEGWTLDPAWSRGVLLLDGPLSRLEISGMAVEFATPRP